MKKFFQSKGFIVSSLALLCVTILGVCWFVSRDRTGDFRPDESPPSSVTGDWSDGGTQTDGDNGADAYAPGQSTDAEEEYPKVTSQTEDEIVIDFTDTEKLEETPPPVPEGKTEIKDPGQEHTVNPNPSVPEVTAPPAEQALPSNEPAPGSSNGNGAIYDPLNHQTYNRRLPMRKFTTRIYTKANYLLNRGRMALSNQRGDFYISDAVKIIIAVVLGALLLAALTLIFNDTVIPRITEEIESLFS